MERKHELVLLDCEARQSNGLFMIDDKLGYIPSSKDHENKELKYKSLFILSDEEIKEGDWHVNKDITLANGKVEYTLYKATKTKIDFIKRMQASNSSIKFYKIIATTDPELWKVSAKEGRYVSIDGLPKIPLDFVERYVKEYNKDNVIKSVMLEYIDISGATVFTPDEPIILKLRSNNTVIIHPVEERKYTQEELRKAFYSYTKEDHAKYADNFDLWIKEKLK